MMLGAHDPPFDLLDTVVPAIRDNKVGWAVLSLVVSHGLSFFRNYILGSPLPALVLLIVLKTAADLRVHKAEQVKFAEAAAAAGAGPASTSFLLTGSTRKLSPSSVRDPSRARSPGSPNTTSSP